MREFDPDYWMKMENYGYDDRVLGLTIDANIDNEKKFADWLPNINENFPHLSEGNILSSRFGEWAGENCLVCGCGPSFYRSIELIREAKARGWKIIAVDRAHKTLKKNFITPDMTVSGDSQAIVGDFLSMVNEMDTMVLALFQHPRMVRKMLKKTFNVFFYLDYNPFSLFTCKLYMNELLPKELFCLMAGGIIGFTAVDLATWMGAAKVGLIGHDLCWHSEDEIETVYKLRKEFPIYEPMGQDGAEPVLTIKPFVSASTTFDHFIQHHPEVEYVDCSKGIIQNFPTGELEELIA